MAKAPLEDAAEIEVICPHCGYHLRRTVARLRRDIKIVCANCGADVVHNGDKDTGDVDE